MSRKLESAQSHSSVSESGIESLCKSMSTDDLDLDMFADAEEPVRGEDDDEEDEEHDREREDDDEMQSRSPSPDPSEYLAVLVRTATDSIEFEPSASFFSEFDDDDKGDTTASASDTAPSKRYDLGKEKKYGKEVRDDETPSEAALYRRSASLKATRDEPVKRAARRSLRSEPEVEELRVEQHRNAKEVQVKKEEGDEKRAPTNAPAPASSSSAARRDSAAPLGRGLRLGAKERRPREERRAASDPVYGQPRYKREPFKRGSINVPYSGLTISRGAASGYLRPSVPSLRFEQRSTVQVADPTPEDVTREEVLRATERQLRRSKKKEEDSENVFPISRKTQTTQAMRQQAESLSTGCQATPIRHSKDSADNTEIDFKLMSKMLQKVMCKKACNATQTESEPVKKDPPPPPRKATKDIAIGTEKFSRERFSSLPDMKSKFAQTDASWLRSQSTAVNTDDDPYYGAMRRGRVRRRDPFTNRISIHSQTDLKPKKDVSVETKVAADEEASLPIEVSGSRKDDEDSVTSVSSDEKEDPEPPVEPKEVEIKYHKVEPELSSTVTLSEEEDEIATASSVDDAREKVTETFQPRAAIEKALKNHKLKQARHTDIPPPADRLIERSFLDDTEVNYNNNTEKEKEPEKEPEAEREVRSPAMRLIPAKSIASLPTEKSEKNVTIQRDPRSKSLMRLFPKEMRTESKVIVEVMNARKREVSEVTSVTEVQQDGKMSRKTTVTTSKKVPVIATSKQQQMLHSTAKTPEPIITSPVSTKISHPASPVPTEVEAKTMKKNQSQTTSGVVSECSTRPNSAFDLTAQTTDSRPQSSLMTSVFSEQEIFTPSTSRGNLTDPLHIEIDEPEGAVGGSDNEDFETPQKYSDYRKQMNLFSGALARKYNSSAKSPPIVWHETSNSTICNEMTTDPFVTQDGETQKPKSVSMVTETTIESIGNENRVQTKSRASRKFDGQKKIHEPAIMSETTLYDTPPFIKAPPQGNPITSRPIPAAPIASVTSAPPKPPRQSPTPVSSSTSLPPVNTVSFDRRSESRDSFYPSRQTSSVMSSKSSLSRASSPRRFLESSLDDIADETVKRSTSPSPSPVPPMHSLPLPRSALYRSEPALASPVLSRDKKDRRHVRLPSEEELLSDMRTQHASLPQETSSSSSLLEKPVRSNIRSFTTPTLQKAVPVSQATLPRAKTSSTENKSLEVRENQNAQEKTTTDTEKSGTELVTRITRTSYPEEKETLPSGEVRTLKQKRSKMVLQQEVQTGDGVYDTSGCHISNSIVMETPTTANNNLVKGDVLDAKSKRKGVVIRELKDDGSFKTPSHSMDDLDKSGDESGESKGQKRPASESDSADGEMVTETKFERFKPGPKSPRDETTWEYSMECKSTCGNGVNTSIRTNVRHKRCYIPPTMTLYESSV